jgi:hypothetical protein
MNCADATPWGVQRREYDPGGLSYSEDFLLCLQGKGKLAVLMLRKTSLQGGASVCSTERGKSCDEKSYFAR